MAIASCVLVTVGTTLYYELFLKRLTVDIGVHLQYVYPIVCAVVSALIETHAIDTQDQHLLAYSHCVVLRGRAVHAAVAHARAELGRIPGVRVWVRSRRAPHRRVACREPKGQEDLKKIERNQTWRDVAPNTKMLAVEWPLVRAAVSEDPTTTPPAFASKAFARLERAKARVPEVVRDNRRAWDRAVATVTTHVPAPGAPPRVASRAYHKLHEIVRSCVLPPPERFVLHLCEAPGGFVQCVQAWTPGVPWCALTLPGGPAPCTDVLDTSTGRFVLGDVHDPACVDARDADLVTADGAVDMDHGNLEAEHFPLLVAQTTVGLRALVKGGTFVIKFFEGARRETQAWMAWLTTRFERVSLIKPHTSRPTNSERYLVARGYDGARDREFQDVAVAAMWTRDLQRVLERMATDQAEALETALARV